MKLKFIYCWADTTKEQRITDLYSGLIDEIVLANLVTIRG